ncbi:bifunctional diguanylate cyclase/phosphodiesterase [Mesorhizobium sp. M1295]|uniref:putative bifunctional diguanylate cyclase/phosphodiesterase n=1 Tax=Mesorhizobium sp. M1295 TaxID=2957076 RepID=UPI00333D3BB5
MFNLPPPRHTSTLLKSVNDTYGHRTGDELLVRIARRIEEEAPEGSTLARIGGDEFVLFFPSTRVSLSASDLASNIIAKIARPYIEVASVRVGASIGIYLAQTPGLTEMLLRADIALYTAKRRGRNEFCLFDAELDRELQRRQSVERDLHSAIKTRSLQPWFQPIVKLDTEAVVGFEALLRWSHPTHGAISPPDIITAARETGMLQLLTQTVFADCCAFIDGLVKADCRDLRVAMNVSPRELEAGDIDDMVLNGLAARGLPATMFEIEITEESPVDPDRVDEKLGRLSHAGISIALDDFGTGFSTLASLKDSRIRKVKIDQGFIRGLAKSREDRLLVKSVIDLGNMLGIEVMAEGVETEADRQTLHKLGCRTAQGFLFSKAVPLSQALEMAVEQHANQL